MKLKEIPLAIPNGLNSVTSIKSIQRGLFKTKVTKRKVSTPVVKDMDNQVVSPISRLIQIAHIRKYKEPEFTVLQMGDPESGALAPDTLNNKPNHHNKRASKRKPTFIIEVKVGPHVATGEGANKKAAKKAAADNALILLGYAPSETKESSTSNSKGAPQRPSAHQSTPTSSSSEGKFQNDLNIVSARQIVPGLLAVSSAGKIIDCNVICTILVGIC